MKWIKALDSKCNTPALINLDKAIHILELTEVIRITMVDGDKFDISEEDYERIKNNEI